MLAGGYTLAENDLKSGTSQPRDSASRTIMLKSAATWIASTSAFSLTPAARTASASARTSSFGRSVSFSRKPRVARSGSLTDAERQSRLTASQTSSPSAYDATAPCAFVQNGHWLSTETKAAKSSRSPRSEEHTSELQSRPH